MRTCSPPYSCKQLKKMTQNHELNTKTFNHYSSTRYRMPGCSISDMPPPHRTRFRQSDNTFRIKAVTAVFIATHSPWWHFCRLDSAALLYTGNVIAVIVVIAASAVVAFIAGEVTVTVQFLKKGAEVDRAAGASFSRPCFWGLQRPEYHKTTSNHGTSQQPWVNTRHIAGTRYATRYEVHNSDRPTQNHDDVGH